MNGKKVLFIIICLLILFSCSQPENAGGDPIGTNQQPPSTQPENTPTEKLIFQADLDNLYISSLPSNLQQKEIKTYQLTGNVIQICKSTCLLPLSLLYVYGPEEYESVHMTDLNRYKEDDPVSIYLNGIEYKSYELDGGISTTNEVFINWNFREIYIRNENINSNYDTSKTVKIKFKFRGLESNELIFMFNQDLGNSLGTPGTDPNILPDITGTWIADKPGLTGTFIFNSNGTGTVYSGDKKQQASLTWKTYKDGLSNILEISSSWYNGVQKMEYSINGSTLTTSYDLGTQGHTFTKQ